MMQHQSQPEGENQMSERPLTMTAEREAIIRSDNVSDVYVAREGIQEIAKELDALRAAHDSSEQTIRELQADKERLDYLQSCVDQEQQRIHGGFTQKLICSGPTITLREALDAARSAPENGAASNAQAPAGQPMTEAQRIDFLETCVISHQQTIQREREHADKLATALQRSKDVIVTVHWGSRHWNFAGLIEELGAALAEHTAMRSER